MASLIMGSCKFFLFFILFSSIPIHFVASTEFLVGGDDGWVVPKSKGDDQYNEWASKNRFKVDDTLRFEYNKDSVLVVTEEEYNKCQSAHPLFFSNNGNTIFQFDRPGLFYFISGVNGHCNRGLKMIIKVLEPANPPQSANDTTPDNPGNKSAAAVEMASISSTAPRIMLISISLLGLILV